MIHQKMQMHELIKFNLKSCYWASFDTVTALPKLLGADRLGVIIRWVEHHKCVLLNSKKK